MFNSKKINKLQSKIDNLEIDSVVRFTQLHSRVSSIQSENAKSVNSLNSQLNSKMSKLESRLLKKIDDNNSSERTLVKGIKETETRASLWINVEDTDKFNDWIDANPHVLVSSTDLTDFATAICKQQLAKRKK